MNLIDPELINRSVELAIEIQQIAAPTFYEENRGAYILKRFRVGGLADVEMDEIGNVFGCRPGSGNALPIIVSAHLDTVFPSGSDLTLNRFPEKLVGPGIGDNAIGLAGLFGLLWELDRQNIHLNSDVWFVANVGEEGLGDLRGMRNVVKRFAGRVQGYIIIEGMALGQVYHRGLGVTRFRITVNTPGGHSWVDYGKPSAVHELSHLVNRLLSLQIPEEPRSSLNVGVLSGGISVNTIAAEASLELDIRSEDVVKLDEIVRMVEQAVRDFTRPDVQVSMELIGKRPVGELSIDHPLVALAVQGLQFVGIKPHLNIGSTDANIPLSLGFPAVCLGLTTGNGAHTQNEYINLAPLGHGIEQLLHVIRGLDRL
ncbi:MAG: M20/M25/M40 family metallo-hydrolase [Chloroflexota bacterium]|nr:MAG: M20/M25/M40 family metallo-hydrolase [Chloroflexota bacterium]